MSLTLGCIGTGTAHRARTLEAVLVPEDVLALRVRQVRRDVRDAHLLARGDAPPRFVGSFGIL